MSDRLLILVADAPSKWRDSLVAALGADEQHEVTVYEDGEAFRAALPEGGRAAAGIIVGQGLTGPSAIDVALEAMRTRSAERGKPLGAAFLVTEIRDAELLDVLRERGFQDFVYREDAPEQTLATITNGSSADRRVDRRYAVELDVIVHLGGALLEAKLENTSRGGAQLTLGAKKAATQLKPGDLIEVEVKKGVRLSATVRRATRRRWFLFERVFLGVQFDSASEERMQEIVRLDQQQLLQKVEDTSNRF